MDATKWYEKEALSKETTDKIIKNGDYRINLFELSANNPHQSAFIKLGDRIELRMNNGLVGYYTITALKDGYGFDVVVGRDETGIQEKGREFCLDAGANAEIYDVAYKVLAAFPWELSSSHQRNMHQQCFQQKH